MNVQALLIPRPPPMYPPTLSTAGSASTARRNSSIFGCMTWNERASSPRMKPPICPVSCSGRKLLGAVM